MPSPLSINNNSHPTNYQSDALLALGKDTQKILEERGNARENLNTLLREVLGDESIETGPPDDVNHTWVVVQSEGAQITQLVLTALGAPKEGNSSHPTDQLDHALPLHENYIAPTSGAEDISPSNIPEQHSANPISVAEPLQPEEAPVIDPSILQQPQSFNFYPENANPTPVQVTLQEILNAGGHLIDEALDDLINDRPDLFDLPSKNPGG